MTDPYRNRRITFYDPRIGQERRFRFSFDRDWNGAKHGIAVFESDSYGFYSNAANVSAIVQAAITSHGATSLLVDVSPRPRISRLSSSINARRIIRDSPERMTLYFDGEQWGDVAPIFAEEANAEKWSFSSMRCSSLSESDCADYSFLTLESQLEASGRWCFGIHLDLDSMLIGWMAADERFDDFRVRAAL